ncbi:hypothetical protein TSAR_008427 [Trichomalopsis sarcophagae]|uniref:Uncharacterized protein n=1 Tax=Trichomalopsis sarcophagae TaxID=543379 RepID=A0A232EJB2_9HYME|nr:hypothetical protein TSAR_008427 [Trichomalopsis sarcophagae]
MIIGSKTGQLTNLTWNKHECGCGVVRKSMCAMRHVMESKQPRFGATTAKHEVSSRNDHVGHSRTPAHYLAHSYGLENKQTSILELEHCRSTKCDIDSCSYQNPLKN